MHVGICCPKFGIFKGGHERFAARLANWLLKAGHSATIFYLDYPGTAPQFPTEREVNLLPVSPGSALADTKIKTLNLDSLVYIYDGGFLSLPLQIGKELNLPLLISEGYFISTGDRFLKFPQYRLATFAAADKVTFFCEAFNKINPEFVRKKSVIIPNCHGAPSGLGWERDENGRKTIILCARLQEDSKRISLLVEAFAKLYKKFPDWDVRIYGDGPDRGKYEAMISSLGLTGRFLLPGITEDVFKAYKEAHLFCMPSYTEGMSIAMLESQAAGLPYIGFERLPGIKEVIQDGYNGLLAPEFTAASLASTLERLMGHHALRKKLAQGAKTASANYTEDKIFGLWEQLVLETAGLKGRNRLSQPPEDEEEAKARNDLEDIFSGEARRKYNRINLKSHLPLIRQLHNKKMVNN